MKAIITTRRSIFLALLFLFAAFPFLNTTRAQDINLTGYTLTFDDEFTSLSVTSSSPKGASTWYYWPPYGAAGAYSASAWNLNAFSITSGTLSDLAFWQTTSGTNGSWQSGNLSSMDSTGVGFAQQYGYFEIRCQMPNAGEGAWPAFWLDGRNNIPALGNPDVGEEIDIFEWYGVTNTPGDDQDLIQQASHNWNTNGTQDNSVPYIYSPGTPMPDGQYPWQGFHIYGCQIDPIHVTWYIDGVQTNQMVTPASYINSPFYVMIDYALGGGWTLSGTPFTTEGSSSLLVDWVRVYSLPSSYMIGVSGIGNSIGLQFVGTGAQLTGTQSAGVPGATQTHWNPVGGSKFGNDALVDNTGLATTAILSGTSSGTYSGGVVSGSPTGNAVLTSGELFNGTTAGSNTSLITHIPFYNYDVYVYASVDVAGRNETISLTPSGGATQYYSFTTEDTGSTWTAATSTWNGSGTAPTLPVANYAHFAGVTGSSFSTTFWAPGNGSINAIQIVQNPIYPLTVSGGSGSGSYQAGAAVTVSASPASVGYQFVGWTGSTGALANASSAYTILTMPGSAAAISATYDAISTYTLWSQIYFTPQQLGQTSVSGPTAIPQGDAIPNVLKYLFGISPITPMTASSLAAMPVAGTTTISGSTYLTLTYRQNSVGSGLTVSVQTSPDLSSWQTVTPTHIVTTGTDPVTGDPQIQDQVLVTPQSALKDFIRLNVIDP